MDWADVENVDFDVVVATCGYESRAPYVISRLRSTPVTLIVFDYECAGAHSYDKNRTYFEGLPYTNLLSLKDRDLPGKLVEALEHSRLSVTDDRPLRILFDVSSCSRSVMAQALLTLAAYRGRQFELTCAYALSAFDGAPEGELPSSVSEPVIGDLSGWSDDLSKPPCAVISLGFEPGRALGTIDYLEVPEVRLFMPQGPDPRFENSVRKANALLIQEAGENAVLPFDVLQPESTFQKLESLVFGLLPRFRPVIIPLGPKIFSAISMVLAIRMFPQVCVWRTSSGSGEETIDRGAGGAIAVFRASPLRLPDPSV